ncbi:MAG: DoxX family membrane protein [Verrucomicrobia bacterium]|nr:DoxX family membrane protein [Verrucomicrobiota bacterium]
MTAKNNSRWHWALCFIFGAVFIFAGYVKVRDPQLFLVAIRGFRVLPDPFAAWLALGLPWLEIFCGLAVMSGFLRRAGLLLLNACLMVFLVAIVIAWSRGLDIECGCFGNTIKTSMMTELVIDLVLLVTGLSLLRRQTSFP